MKRFKVGTLVRFVCQDPRDCSWNGEWTYVKRAGKSSGGDNMYEVTRNGQTVTFTEKEIERVR